MNIDQLNTQFGIPGNVEFIIEKGGLSYIKISNTHANALISLLGGQLLSYQPVSQSEDMLFISEKSFYEDGKAIRGGIPVCWPWFGVDPKGLQRPNHGFVRNHFWSVAHTASTPGETTVRLQFSEDHKAEKTWKHPFTLVLEFKIGTTLNLSLTTHNFDNKPFAITQAFHTYFKVGDINQVEVLGLEGCTYYDKLDQGRQKAQNGIVTIREETDRIYQDVDNLVVLNDKSLKRRIEIVSENCKTGVVWNPWAKAMPDLNPGDYRHFLCVETGNIAFDLIQIPPGGAHSLITTFTMTKN